MTNECRIKYIQALQCKYSSFVYDLVQKLKLGRICKDLEEIMLIVRDYIKSLYCYKALSEIVQVYGFKLEPITIDEDDEFTNITLTITINGIPSVVYNLTSPTPVFPLIDILNAAYTFVSYPLGFQAVINNQTNEIYLYSEDTPTATITANLTYVTNQTSGSINYTVTSSQEYKDFVVDQMNCLTTKEICSITHHAFSLLEKCNC